MPNRLRALALASLLTAASLLAAARQGYAAQEVPPELTPPAGQLLFLLVHAKGDQIYTCKNDSGKFAWTLKAPEAQLFDNNDKPVGKHFAGPSWEATDGSRVTGKPLANAPAPAPDSIPWLLITVVSQEGTGVLSRAAFIQRLNT